MEEVEQICSNIAIIDKGKVVAQGTKEELKGMISIGEKISIETYQISEEQQMMIKEMPNVVSVEYDDNQLIIKSGKGRNNLIQVLHFMEVNKIDCGKVFTQLPTLNDVFLEITGKELRD
jgi:ABC-2 type transport system ATP-binding protein